MPYFMSLNQPTDETKKGACAPSCGPGSKAPAVFLPRASRGISRAGPSASLPVDPPVLRSAWLPKHHLRTPAPYWFDASASRLNDPVSRLDSSGAPPRSHESASSTALGPASQFDPGLPSPSLGISLSRGLCPKRNPARRSHRSRTFHLPGHVASLRFLPASTPFSPPWPPRCLSTGRSFGFFPSELDLTGVASTSRWRIPSCDWPLIRQSAAHGLQRQATCEQMTMLERPEASLQGFVPRGRIRRVTP